MVLFLLNLKIIHTFDFGMSIAGFEKMNARWKVLVEICLWISLHIYKEISCLSLFSNHFETADII